MLLQTEVIGLNAKLALVGVPGIRPQCDCGWHMKAAAKGIRPFFSETELELSVAESPNYFA
jgi:hypothetical protein